MQRIITDFQAVNQTSGTAPASQPNWEQQTGRTRSACVKMETVLNIMFCNCIRETLLVLKVLTKVYVFGWQVQFTESPKPEGMNVYAPDVPLHVI